MAYIDAQVTDLVGGTIDQTACDQWAVDGAREIIMQLPAALQERCSDFSVLNNSPTTLDLDTAANAKVGKVLYCTRYSGTRYLPCRLVAPENATLTDDSTATNYYATNDDPAYYISDNTVVIKPTTDATYIGRVYHVVYPTSLNISAVTAGDMTTFPIECEHLLVLYISMKQLLQYQSTMSTNFNTDIGTAFTAVNTELDETQSVCDKIDAEIVLANAEVDGISTTLAHALTLTDDSSSEIQVALDAMKTAADKFRADGSDPALFGDESTYTTGSSAMTKVKLAVDNAISLIGLSTAGDKYHADYDLEAIMSDIDTQITAEDIELAGSRMQQAQTQMAAVGSHLNVAQAHISEWNTMVQTLVAEVNAYASEVGSRYGWINAKAVVWQGKLSAAQGYMATANGYTSEVQTKIAIANGYIAEANARLQSDVTKYQWYSDQYTKLSADYVRGLTALQGV